MTNLVDLRGLEPLASPQRWQERVPDGWGGGNMDDHQRSAIECARIAWHDHQFEHGCYGRDCAEDRTLYHAYQRAIRGDLAEPGEQPEPPDRSAPDRYRPRE